jgi:hypothetical protein
MRVRACIKLSGSTSIRFVKIQESFSDWPCILQIRERAKTLSYVSCYPYDFKFSINFSRLLILSGQTLLFYNIYLYPDQRMYLKYISLFKKLICYLGNFIPDCIEVNLSKQNLEVFGSTCNNFSNSV